MDNLIFYRQKQFVNLLYDHFNLSPLGPRGSALKYGDSAYYVAAFGDQNFKERVNRTDLLQTPRKMDLALRRATQIIAETGRDEARKIVILMIAGKQAYQMKSFKDAVKPLQELGAQIFVVAIGPNTASRNFNIDELKNIIRVPVSSRLKDRSKAIANQIRRTPGKIYMVFFFRKKKLRMRSNCRVKATSRFKAFVVHILSDYFLLAVLA